MTTTSEQPEKKPAISARAEDARIVRQVLDGDTEAFNELVDKYQGKIYALVYNMTSNSEDARDMVQEVFVKAYSALPRFKGNSSFYTWIYRIALNRTINFIQKRKRRQTSSLDDVESSLERDPELVELAGRHGPVRDLALTELQERLNVAVQTLSEKHRTVVVMHDIEGVPHDEIARILNVSSGTVRSRLFYARQRLQVELADLVS